MPLARKILRALALAFLVCSGLSRGDMPVLRDQFDVFFPRAVQDGKCLVVRLNNCKIIGVTNEENDYDETISYLFVIGKDKNLNRRTAKQLASLFHLSKRSIKDFTDNDTSVAIECPANKDTPSDFIPCAIIRKLEHNGHEVEFAGWKDKLLIIRTECDFPESDETKYIEIFIDLTAKSFSYMDFHFPVPVTSLYAYKIKALQFIGENVWDVSELVAPRVRDKNRFDKLGGTLLALSAMNNYVVIAKKGYVRTGFINTVERSLTNPPKLAKDFIHPASLSTMPGVTPSPEFEDDEDSQESTSLAVEHTNDAAEPASPTPEESTETPIPEPSDPPQNITFTNLDQEHTTLIMTNAHEPPDPQKPRPTPDLQGYIKQLQKL